MGVPMTLSERVASLKPFFDAEKAAEVALSAAGSVYWHCRREVDRLPATAYFPGHPTWEAFRLADAGLILSRAALKLARQALLAASRQGQLPT